VNDPYLIVFRESVLRLSWTI